MGRAFDGVIMELAASQHGVVTREQLLDAGIPVAAVDYRVKVNWLRAIHRGVYGVGPILPRKAREKAAELACGKDAAISHCSGGGLWHLADPPAESNPVDVTVPPGSSIRRPGIRIHRSASLRATDVTELSGIRVTTPARTLVDLASVLDVHALEQAIANAEERGLTTVDEVFALAARTGKPRGMRELRKHLEAGTRPAVLKSTAEREFRKLLKQAKLPLPQSNVWVAGYRVDDYWPDRGIIVEVDGYAFHSTRRRVRKDRKRDIDLQAQGLEVIRVTWDQIKEEPLALMVQMTRILDKAEARRRAVRSPG